MCDDCLCMSDGNYYSIYSGKPIIFGFITNFLLVLFTISAEIHDQQQGYVKIEDSYSAFDKFKVKKKYSISGNTSLGYSQLKPQTTMKESVSTSLAQSNSNVSTAGKILRCLSKPSISAMPRPKSRNKKKKNEEMEREWLLLGEPASPRNTVILDNEQDTSSLTTPAPTVNQDVEALQTPTNEVHHQTSTDTDSSTDIDAVFDEYRQKIEVTTSGPSEKVLRIPSMESWRVSMVLMTIYFVGVLMSIIGFIFQSFVVFGGGVVGKINQFAMDFVSVCSTFSLLFSCSSVHTDHAVFAAIQPFGASTKHHFLFNNNFGGKYFIWINTFDFSASYYCLDNRR